MQPELSILMLTFNRLYYTQQTLDRLLKTVDVSYELIISDNGSVDGTKEFLESFKGIQLISHKKNIGMGPALNIALKQSTGETIMKLDNDILLPDHWASILVDAYQKGKEEKGVGWLNPIVEGEFPFRLPTFRIGDYIYHVGPPVAGPCGITDKDLLKSIGGFRYSRFKYGAVDGGTNTAIHSQKRKVCWLENLVAIHLESGDRNRFQDYWQWKLSIIKAGRSGANVKDLDWNKYYGS
jgi:glycosyltransferase involved in cell wall biosynthesis